MPNTPPQDLFERPWRAGLPFRPRGGRRRQIATFLLLCFLATIIGLYWYVTDSNRVRKMAEEYLSKITGAKVTVLHASLSPFEGLRLDDVTLAVPNENRPDSVLAKAQTLLVKYDLTALLNGTLHSTQIVALDPQIFICQNVSEQGSSTNFQRLHRANASRAPSQPAASTPTELPEIIVRNGQATSSQIENGVYSEKKSVAFEGRLTPGDEGQFSFALDHRPISPSSPQANQGGEASGLIDLPAQRIDLKLTDVEFAGYFREFLPWQIQNWFKDHGVEGTLGIPSASVQIGPDGTPHFNVEVEIARGRMVVYPREWLGPGEQLLAPAQTAAASLAPITQGPERKLRDKTGEPIVLTGVTGRLVFTENGITIGDSFEPDLFGRIEENSFAINGLIKGYSPSAPANLTVVSSEIKIPVVPKYIHSMPHNVQDFYYRFHPAGLASLEAHLDRPVEDGPVAVTGTVHLIDCDANFVEFPYPVSHVKGDLKFAKDPVTNEDRIDLIDVEARGQENTPNEYALFTVDGYVSPLTRENAVHVAITAKNVTLDQPVFNALPLQTRLTLKQFAPPNSPYPKIVGNVSVKVQRSRGLIDDTVTNVDVDVQQSDALFNAFPYPLHNLVGSLHFRPNTVTLDHLTMNHNDGSLSINGQILTPDNAPSTTNLQVSATSLPIDADLLNALPQSDRQWILDNGLTGNLDLDGSVSSPPDSPRLNPPNPSQIHPKKRPPGLPSDPNDPDSPVVFDLRLSLSHATLFPINNLPTLVDASAQMHLTPQRLIVSSFHARHADSQIQGHLLLSFPQDQPTHLNLYAQGLNVPFDPAVRHLLPLDAQTTWDKLAPEGAADAELTYASSSDNQNDGYEVTIHPKNAAATYQSIPYRLTNLTGSVTINPDHVEIQNLQGRHNSAKVSLDGEGLPTGQWNLHLTATSMPVDNDLIKALPDSIAKIVNNVDLKGTLNLDVPTLVYSASPSTTASTNSSEKIAFSTKITLVDAALDPGIDITGLNGAIDLTGVIANGTLQEAGGSANFPSLLIAGQPASNFQFDVIKPPDRQAIQLARIQGQLMSGDFAGQVDFAFPDDGPSQYALKAALRNADVRQLAGSAPHAPSGQLSASLLLEGNSADPASRRGGGNVQVQGKELYRVPLVLGLLQFTDLALPISSPYDNCSTTYTLEGQTIHFQQIQLQAGNMIMNGDGDMDFASHKVNLTFTTDSEGGFKIPLLTDVIKGVRGQLLQIHVNGTIHDPQVSTKSLNLFTTTIDQVFGNPEKPPK